MSITYPPAVEQWANLGAADQLDYLDDTVRLDLHFIGTLLRAAYAQGYTDAHSEPEPLSIDQAVRNREMLLLKLPVV